MSTSAQRTRSRWMQLKSSFAMTTEFNLAAGRRLRRFRYSEGVLACAFRGVKRLVRALQQFVRVRAVDRVDGDARAGARADRRSLDGVGRRQRLDQLGCHGNGVVRPFGVP